ncbi:MAG: endolytic transglycosylase MltG [Clostridia bacterium]|nr:endolytic transglycosylase MltG [Clostridia bacterium]
MSESQKNPKKSYVIIGIVALLLVCIILFISPYISEYNDTTSENGRVISFEIAEGQSAYSVASSLADKELIKSKYTFLIKYYLNGDDYPGIYPGEYSLHKGMCLADILKKISVAPEPVPQKETYTLVIPEGYSAEMIAAKCNRLGICTKEEFLEAVDATDYTYEFIKHIPEGGYRHKLEGFLFPATYEFYVDATPHDMVNKMLATFEERYLAEFSSYDNLFYNVTVASMIEREAAVASERATISGVIKNRLEKPMRLQLDATAVYAKSNGYYDIENVTASDVRFESTYNTYLCDGLPPGPICSAGIASIVAAANPEEHNWYYYHTDEVKKDGSHIFTETYNEHNTTMTN